MKLNFKINTQINTQIRWVVGIDEVGRGPLAGPVTVGAVLMAIDVYKSDIFAGVKESKQLSASKRAYWMQKLSEHKNAGLLKSGLLKYSVASSSPKIIDKHGLTFAVQSALNRAIKKLDVDEIYTHVLLDGLLHAPAEFKYQTTIKGGDRLEPIIAVASITAKEHRDALMIKYAKKYPLYGFECHKGYGTKKHYLAIKKHGLTVLHRRRFLKNCTNL